METKKNIFANINTMIGMKRNTISALLLPGKQKDNITNHKVNDIPDILSKKH
jgi:hypothetical protein